MKYHLVFIIKYRHPVLTDEVSSRLYEITRKLFSESWKCTVFSMKTDRDHIHVLFEAPPQVYCCKTVSSRLLRKEFADFLKPYY